MIAGTGASAVIDGAVIVTNNDDMTELEIWSSGLKTLTITGNSDLSKITGEKIIAIGATAGPTVTISSNDLEASVAQVLTPKTASAVSTGAFTTASNMGSLSTYLGLVAADTAATAAVYYDTVQSTTDSATLETGSTTTGTDAANSILVITPGTADTTVGANALVLQQRAWQIPATAGMDLNITIDGAELLHNGTGYGTVTSTGNLALDLVALKSNLATTRATTLGTELNVRAEGNPLMPSVTFLASVTSATGGNGENYTNTEVAAIGAGTNKTFVTSYDVFTLTIDGKSASASVTLIAGATSATGAVAARDIVLALDAAWTPYGTGASSTQSLWDTTSATAVLSTALKSSNSGSRGFGKAVSIAWTKATADQVSTATAGLATSTIMDWTIGATEATTDNTAAASALVLTLTEVTNSVAKGDQVTATLRGANGIIELATTQYTKTNGSGAYLVTGVATTTATDIHETDARGDVVNREAANEGTTTAGTARFITNRSGWTFSVGS
jgi:hypothetical protein